MPLQQLEYEVSFSEKKKHRKRHILKLFFIEMPVSLKVFVPEKRDCTFLVFYWVTTTVIFSFDSALQSGR